MLKLHIYIVFFFVFWQVGMHYALHESINQCCVACTDIVDMGYARDTVNFEAMKGNQPYIYVIF